jgi:hypothetical protein
MILKLYFAKFYAQKFTLANFLGKSSEKLFNSETTKAILKKLGEKMQDCKA